MKSHFSIQLYKKRGSAVINESAHHRLHVPHLLATLATHWKRLQIAVFCHANLSGRFNCCHAFNFACVTCYTQHAAQHTYFYTYLTAHAHNAHNFNTWALQLKTATHHRYLQLVGGSAQHVTLCGAISGPVYRAAYATGYLRYTLSWKICMCTTSNKSFHRLISVVLLHIISFFRLQCRHFLVGNRQRCIRKIAKIENLIKLVGYTAACCWKISKLQIKMVSWRPVELRASVYSFVSHLECQVSVNTSQ